MEELQNLAMVVENTHRMVVITDRSGAIEWVNPAFTKITGYSFDEVKGKRPGKLLQGAATDPATRRFFNENMSSGKPFHGEVLNYTKSGHPYWVKIHCQPVYNDAGDIHKFFSIQEDITYQKKMEEDLLIAKEAAEASEKAKRKFLAHMSHEIRTPMNAIIGLSEQLLKTTLNRDQQFYSETIHAAANNLLTIINDILDISKIEEGKLKLECIPMNLKEVVEKAIHILQFRAEEKKLRMGFEFDVRIHPFVFGDPYRLNQVLLNIIGNAIKFTHTGSVQVQCIIRQCSDTRQLIDIHISDTGIGVDEQMIDNLFSEFEQGDQSYGRKYGGTGLGLTITKNLVEMMNGSIQFKSRKFAGTTVSITLPFEKQGIDAYPVKPVSNSDHHLLKDKKVLLVEDNKFNSLVASIILKNARVNALFADNGEHAIEMLKEHLVDVILMDIQMPVMDGLKATTIIRKELGLTAPIIALTAHALNEEKEHYLDAGMNDFLAKPYTESQLLDILVKWTTNGQEQPKLFNTRAIREFTGLDDQFIRVLSRTFLEDLKESNDQLKQLLASGDWKGIRLCIHKMKPGFIMFGFSQVIPQMKAILDARESATTFETHRTHLEEYLEFALQLQKEMNTTLAEPQ